MYVDWFRLIEKDTQSNSFIFNRLVYYKITIPDIIQNQFHSTYLRDTGHLRLPHGHSYEFPNQSDYILLSYSPIQNIQHHQARFFLIPVQIPPLEQVRHYCPTVPVDGTLLWHHWYSRSHRRQCPRHYYKEFLLDLRENSCHLQVGLEQNLNLK